MLQLGFSMAVFIGGPLSDLFEKRRLLMFGLALLGVNFVLFGLSSVFLLSLAIVALIGIGGGLIESSSNPLLVRLFPDRESTVMNLHHFFFAVGSLIGPAVMGTLLAHEVSWGWAYFGVGSLVILLLLMVAFSKEISTREGPGINLKSIHQILRHRAFQILCLLVFFSSGVQNGIVYWMVSFLKEVRGLTIAIAGASLSLFFVCLAIGRLSTSYLIARFNEIHYMIGLLCLLAVALFLSVLVSGRLAILFFAVCGLALSALLPISLAITGKIFPQNPGTPMGILATASGLGATVVPWAMSLVSDLTNLQTGFMVLELLVLCDIGLLGLNAPRLALAIKS
jgi:FHS family glucose/mannose:H+ symporter-like MFS transporter